MASFPDRSTTPTVQIFSRRDPKTTHEKEPPVSRYFFVGMALFLTAIAVVGFWPTYLGPVFLGQDPPPDWGFVAISWPLHLHTAVFMGWLALLLAQTGLVAGDQTRRHMRLGSYGVAFGFVVILAGVCVTFVHMQGGVAEGTWTWAEAPVGASNSLIPILVQFPLLLGLGYAYRSSPAAHKRYMLLATALLVTAANHRIMFFVWPGEWTHMLLWVAEIGPLWLYDLYVERRIHPATAIGTGIVLLYMALKPLLQAF